MSSESCGKFVADFRARVNVRPGLLHDSVKFESRGKHISLKSAGGIRDDIVPLPRPQSESDLLAQASGFEESPDPDQVRISYTGRATAKGL